MIKILFVCTGNICRSPMAEAVMRKKVADAGLEDRILVDSAGTIEYHQGEEADSRTLEVLRSKGIDFPSKSRPLNRSDLEEFDYLIGMDRSHLEVIEHMQADVASKPVVRLLMDFVEGKQGVEIPDPYYAGGFTQVFEMVEEGCEGLLSEVVTKYNLE